MRNKAMPNWVLAQIFNEPFLTRFWSKIIRGGPDECWNWTDHTSSGYGNITLWSVELKKRNAYQAHRISWMLAHKQEVPEGLMVLHSCINNRRCCNPNHLRLGNDHDNGVDCVMQGRRPSAKLKPEQVINIRQAFVEGKVPWRQLAVEYGVSKDAIRKIVRRINWAHLP